MVKSKDERVKKLTTKLLFDNTKESYEERKDYLNETLNNDLLSRIITREIALGRNAESSFSGYFTEQLGNYLLGGTGIGSPRRASEPFYPSERYYKSHKAISRITRPWGLMDGYQQETRSKEFLKSTQEDKNGYLMRLFNPETITVDNLRNFIKQGFCKGIPEEISDPLLRDNLENLRQIILKICDRKKDLIFLNYFDGSRNLNDIASELGISHQAVSKKLKKISEKARKKVAKLQKKDTTSEGDS